MNWIEFEIKDLDGAVLKAVIQDKHLTFIDLAKNRLSVRIPGAEFKFKDPTDGLRVFNAFIDVLQGNYVELEDIGYIHPLIAVTQPSVING